MFTSKLAVAVKYQVELSMTALDQLSALYSSTVISSGLGVFDLASSINTPNYTPRYRRCGGSDWTTDDFKKRKSPF